MTITVTTFDINDQELEDGFAQAAQAYLDATGQTLTPEAIAAAAFEAYRGSAKAAIIAQAESLDYATLAASVAPAISAAAQQTTPPIKVPATP